MAQNKSLQPIASRPKMPGYAIVDGTAGSPAVELVLDHLK
jgi:hypothetical protein